MTNAHRLHCGISVEWTADHVDGDPSVCFALYDDLRGDSQMVQRWALEMYARGLSTRDIEDAFTDEQGLCLLSRSKVSEVTEVL